MHMEINVGLAQTRKTRKIENENEEEHRTWFSMHPPQHGLCWPYHTWVSNDTIIAVAVWISFSFVYYWNEQKQTDLYFYMLMTN